MIQIMKFIYQLLFILIFVTSITFTAPLKLLHLGFHKGCINDFEYVAQELNLNVTSWFILENIESARKFYGKECDINIYNIRHEDAERIWETNKHYFNTFDAIITSDTVPLSRPFIQNGWKKPLIIWICNRFDLRAGYDKKCIFPDPEFYDLMRSANNMPNVFIASYTPYEQEYAITKNVHFSDLVIRPIGLSSQKNNVPKESLIPAHIDKSKTLYLAPRFFHKSHLEFVTKQCNEQGITIYYGKYNGPDDLAGFKGIIHFPYQASVLSLFENMHRGMVYFIPSPSFTKKILAEHGDIIPHFWQPGPLGQERAPEFWHSEFYRPEHEPLFVYFDSWLDLKEKIKTTNYDALKTTIKTFAQWHRNTMIKRWKLLFEGVTKYLDVPND